MVAFRYKTLCIACTHWQSKSDQRGRIKILLLLKGLTLHPVNSSIPVCSIKTIKAWGRWRFWLVKKKEFLVKKIKKLNLCKQLKKNKKEWKFKIPCKCNNFNGINGHCMQWVKNPIHKNGLQSSILQTLSCWLSW